MNKKNILLVGLALGMIGATGLTSVFSNPNHIAQADTFNYVDNEVTNVSIIPGYDKTMRFLLITLKTTDYGQASKVDVDLDGEGHRYNWRDIADFGDSMTIDGEHFEVIGYNTYFRYYSNPNTIGIKLDNSIWENIKEGSTITVPAGTLFPTYNVMFGSGYDIYRTKNDVSFTYKDGRFRLDTFTTFVDSDVDTIDIQVGYNGSDKYLRFFLSENDYADIPNTSEYNNRNDFKLLTIPDSHILNMSYNISNFESVIKYKGEAINLEDVDTFLNYRCIAGEYGNIALKFTNVLATFKSGDEIFIPKGTTFPSFKCLIGESTDVYKTTKDRMFTYYQGGFHCCEDFAKEETFMDSTKHWKECSICEKHIGEGSHNIVSGDKAPTCTEPGFNDCQFCTECGYVAVEGTPVAALGHDFSGSYQYDENQHWKVCQREGCDEITLCGNHSFDNDSAHRHCDTCDFIRNVAIINVTNGYINDRNDNIILIGTSITIIANTPAPGKAFEGWYVDNNRVSDLNTYTFVVEDSLNIEARYKDAPKEDDPTSKGCDGSIFATSTLVAALSAIGITLLTKKRRK